MVLNIFRTRPQHQDHVPPAEQNEGRGLVLRQRLKERARPVRDVDSFKTLTKQCESREFGVRAPELPDWTARVSRNMTEENRTMSKHGP